MVEKLRHLLVNGTVTSEPYTYPRKVRGKSLVLKPRIRASHGAHLAAELRKIERDLAVLRKNREAVGVATDRGVFLEFAGEPGFELALQSLDQQRSGIELVAVREERVSGEVTVFATVFVPPGKLRIFTKQVERYLTEEHHLSGKPKHQNLLDNIAEIRRAALRSFWTDEPGLFPTQRDAKCWWEVWLRTSSDRGGMEEQFRELATRLGIEVPLSTIEFPERTILLALASPEELEASVDLLDCLAELRLAKEPPCFFASQAPKEQAAWIADLAQRVIAPAPTAPAVCVLDTGINRSHPLLAPALAPADLHSCDPGWGTADHHGHGTEMAGLALYGDVHGALATKAPIPLEHRLESVKLLPAPGFPPNNPRLYGELTCEAVARAEIASPERPRVVCMAVSTDYRDRGRPSSWSAAIDKLVSSEDGFERLVVVAAGSVHEEDWRHYPHYNDVAQVEDPGQAWNALTVGAVTDRCLIRDPSYRGWKPIALPGTLSPASSTSLSWQSKWPNKPDVVLEGGNGALDGAGRPSALDDLAIVTTSNELQSRFLNATWGTSPAAAQAARMAAVLMARYPGLWPETIRALLVHSAEWTDAMRAESFVASGNKIDPTTYLLRRYGYGVPSLERASWSAANHLTLVAQEWHQPYDRPESTVQTKDSNLHDLPWPKAELLKLGETEVRLRATLSYFIEPAPSGRAAFLDRYRYASHGLRFSVRKPGESTPDFQARVSRDAQEEEYEIPMPGDPGWTVGRRRDRGSIHSDWRTETAASIADRGIVAVYPVGGWWRERPKLGRWSKRVRYSLVISISTPREDVDVYTPVAQAIGLPQAVTV